MNETIKETELLLKLQPYIWDKPSYIWNTYLEIIEYLSTKYSLGFEIDEYIKENEKLYNSPSIMLWFINNKYNLQKMLLYLLDNNILTK